MIFSERLLFLHVPKTGGSSVVQFLLRVLPRPVHYSIPDRHEAQIPAGVERFHGIAHEALAEARGILERRGVAMEELSAIVACVRNPYALEVSRYSFLRQDFNSYNHGSQQALALLGNFELFATCSRPHGDRPLEAFYVLDGAPPVNLHILRLEEIDEALPRCLEAAGIEVDPESIPHHNRSRHEMFSAYYTAAAEEAVYQKYKWVFDSGLYPRLEVDGAPRVPRVFDDADLLSAVVRPDRLAAQDAFARANGWLAAAEIHRHARRHGPWRQAVEAAYDEARDAGSDRLLTRAVFESARCLGLGGGVPVEEGIRSLEGLLETAPVGRVAMKLALAELHAARGDFSRARALCADMGGRRVEVALAPASAAGSIELLAGDAETGERLLRGGRPWNESDFGADRAEALSRLGRHTEAARLAAHAEATAPLTDDVAQTRWRRVRAKAAAARGESALALFLVSEAVAIAHAAGRPNVHADALLDMGTVLDAAGLHDNGRDAVQRAVCLYERKGNVASAARGAAWLAGGVMGHHQRVDDVTGAAATD